MSDAVLRVLEPLEQTVPLVFASPHSGRSYAQEFLAMSQLDALALRKSEDTFVDELFGDVPRFGAPLLSAMFPRAYVDANREPLELDPSMFTGRLPDNLNARTPRVAAGLGTIPRVVGNGADIYAKRIPATEIEKRLSGYYWPYHAKLKELVEKTQQRFGYSILIDCHSMPPPSQGPAVLTGMDGNPKPADFVLGDCWGSSCAGVIMDVAEAALEAQGYRVVRNVPYAGGHVTRSYGQPRKASHALQIEINRALYMDEALHMKHSGFSQLARDLSVVVNALAHIPAHQVFPLKAAQ